jgi:hypothetical protein
MANEFSYEHRYGVDDHSYYQLTSPSGLRLNLHNANKDTAAFIEEANAAIRGQKPVLAKREICIKIKAIGEDREILEMDTVGLTHLEVLGALTEAMQQSMMVSRDTSFRDVPDTPAEQT